MDVNDTGAIGLHDAGGAWHYASENGLDVSGTEELAVFWWKKRANRAGFMRSTPQCTGYLA
jgi:hypothetical protein